MDFQAEEEHYPPCQYTEEKTKSAPDILHWLHVIGSGGRGKAPYHPTGSLSTRCLCSGQAYPKVEALASYSQTKLETKIPSTLLPRLNKG